MQIDVGEVAHHPIKQLRFFQFFDGVVLTKLLENQANIRGKTADVLLKVRPSMRRANGFQGVLAGVVEGQTGYVWKNKIQINPGVLVSLIGFQDGLFRWLKNTFHTSEKQQGNNDPGEVGVLEVTPEIIGYAPHERGK